MQAFFIYICWIMAEQNEVKPSPTLAELTKALRDQDLKWADYYLQCFNKRKASELLGVSAVTGHIVYTKPEVQAYINFRLQDTIGISDEYIGILRAMADTDLKDYLTPVKRVVREPMEITISKLIADLQFKIDIEEEWCLVMCETPLETSQSMRRLKEYQKEMFKLKAERKQNSRLVKIIDGPEKLITEMVLDLNKVAADKEGGRIKTYKNTKDGVHIEMYDAKDAAIQLLKIAGRYAADAQPVNLNFDNADIVFK